LIASIKQNLGNLTLRLEPDAPSWGAAGWLKSYVLYKSVGRAGAAQQEEPRLERKFLFFYFQ
jgi:hypothetical protein